MVYRKAESSRFCLCGLLLPSIFLLSSLKYRRINEIYSLSVWFALGNVVYCTLFKLGRPFGWRRLLPVSLLVSALQAYFSGRTWPYFVVFELYALLVNASLRQVPGLFPRSFSRCEISILAQGASIAIAQSVLCFLSVMGDQDCLCSPHLPTKIMQILYFGVLVIVAQPVLLRRLFPDPVRNIYFAILSGVFFTYASLVKMMRTEPVVWLVHFLFHSEKRVQLMQIWCVCIAVSILFATLWTRYSGSQANTVIRKFYHIAILLVFLTGAKYDLNLLYFTSGGGLLIMVLLEMVRLTRLPPLGAPIEAAFRQFRDEKDSGPLTLTHIYLLVGFSLPIWLVPELRADLIFASGLVTIGFGDTAASIIGYSFGRHRWPGSKKTYEGSIGALLAQLLGGLVFYWYIGLPLGAWLVAKLALISALITLIEARTQQVDNLILPLYFHLIWLSLELATV